jgi:hypothetical protein
MMGGRLSRLTGRKIIGGLACRHKRLYRDVAFL